MSQYHRLTILSVEGARVELELVVTDAVNGNFLPTAKSWALMALHEPTWTYLGKKVTRPQGPLAEVLSPQTILDSRWAKANVDKYVKSVKQVEKSNFPIKDGLAYNESKGTPAEALARARYVVTLTDPKWAEHLRPGLSWDSCAFEV